MEIYLLFIIGTSFCIFSVLLLTFIQLKKGTKHGFYKSVFKSLNNNEMKHVKTSGILFLIGTIALFTGAILNANTL